MKKRLLLLLPIIVLLWFVGWTLYWFGSKLEAKRKEGKERRKKPIGNSKFG